MAASRLVATAGSRSQGEPPEPLQPLHDNAALDCGTAILKKEPVMNDASKSGAWDMQPSQVIRGAKSTLSSGEIPVRCDTEPDEVQVKANMPPQAAPKQSSLQQVGTSAHGCFCAGGLWLVRFSTIAL